MEAQDPTTDVRFQCSQPARLHNKVSNELTPEDFVCNDGDDSTSEPGTHSFSDLFRVRDRPKLSVSIQ